MSVASELKQGVVRVARILRLREFEERARRQDFGVALAVEAEAQRVVDDLRGDIDRLHSHLRQALDRGEVRPEALLDFQAAMDAAEERVDRALVSLDRARRDRVAKESIWRDARRRSLALKRLQERRHERWVEEVARQERKDSDEVAIMRFVRAKQVEEHARPPAAAES